MQMTRLDTPLGRTDPLDCIEEFAVANQWPFERNGADEIAFAIGGSQAQYHLVFSWHSEAHALELRCALDIPVPARRYAEAAELLTRLNSMLWIGHLDAAPGAPGIVYRHTLLSGGPDALRSSELETLIDAALTSCERCVPAVMFLLWGGKRPAEAVAAAMIETAGEA